MNPEEATEVGDAIAQAFDAYITCINAEKRELLRHNLAELLWDNKIGIAHVLRDYGKSRW